MTREEAKIVLHAYDPGVEASDDPQMEEVLEQTRRDPDLLAWFNQQQVLDAAVRDKLRVTPVPRGLAEKILAGRSVASQRRRNRFLMPLVLAASVVFLCSLGVLTLGRLKAPTSEFAAFQSDMADFLVEFPKLDLATDQWPGILLWLTGKPAFARAEIPPSLQKFPGLGCREVKWRGRSLMLVCFAAQGEVVHLFVLPTAALADAPIGSTPAFARAKGWSTASWRQGEISYLVLTRGRETFLKGILPNAPPG